MKFTFAIHKLNIYHRNIYKGSTYSIIKSRDISSILLLNYSHL